LGVPGCKPELHEGFVVGYTMQVSLVLVIDIKFLSEFGALAVWFVLVIMILVRMADHFDP
jgi:hypothetical protein